MQTFTITPEHHHERIDRVLTSLLQPSSRSFAQKLIRQGLVNINGKVAKKGNRVAEGNQIEIRELKLKESKFSPADIPLEILYEDHDVIVVNKPAGLLTHPSPAEKKQTLVNAILHHCSRSLSGIGGQRRPGIVHRLDKDTSGVLIVAKHEEALRDLAQQFQDRKIEKHYLALVLGKMESHSGTIEAPLIKTHGRAAARSRISASKSAKDSTTHFWVKQAFADQYALLDVRIVTGRMHQIRVHLAAIKHPVVGDRLYGNRKLNKKWEEMGLKRQFLHAWKLSFKHPMTKEKMSFEAPLPEELQTTLGRLSITLE